MSVIILTDVSKSFRKQPLLSNVNLSIEKGKSYGLIGPNGAGKSVLLKLICGFLKPDIGTVHIAPEYMSARRTFPSDFGVIINGPVYLPHHTGYGNLAALAKIRNTITEQDIRATMLSLHLDPDSTAPVRRYSMGMKQKLALAQALMEHPHVLLLDEPFNALDEASVRTVKRLLRERPDTNTTLLFTSHNAQDINDLADTVFHISNNTVHASPSGKLASTEAR